MSAIDRLIVAAGSAIFDRQIPDDTPAGEAAMRGVLDALPALLRENSPAGEDLRARLGLTWESVEAIERHAPHEVPGEGVRMVCHGSAGLRKPSRRIVGEWGDLP